MKIVCQVIEDLLPLYIDDVCSKESKEIVEEHLKGCTKCKKQYELILEEWEMKGQENDDVETINRISSRWKNDMKKSLVKGFLVAVLVCLILHCFIAIKPM